MLFKVVFIVCAVVAFVNADLNRDVLETDYSSNQRSARNLLLRSYDVIPANVSFVS